jgi:hypothetical protein
LLTGSLHQLCCFQPRCGPCLLPSVCQPLVNHCVPLHGMALGKAQGVSMETGCGEHNTYHCSVCPPGRSHRPTGSRIKHIVWAMVHRICMALGKAQEVGMDTGCGGEHSTSHYGLLPRSQPLTHRLAQLQPAPRLPPAALQCHPGHTQLQPMLPWPLGA